jgi:glucokinase
MSPPFDASTPLKMQSLPSRPSQLRQVNARGLLQLVQAHNPCSKADLVRFSGLSAPTVSSGIAHLEQLGLIEQLGDGESNGGRPPGMLRFNARHGYVAAVDIGGTRLRMMLADLSGNVVTQSSLLLGESQKTPRGVCDLVMEGLRDMCKQSETPIGKLLHLTAGAPGIANVDQGVVLSAPNLKDWNNVPLRDLLKRAVGLPCIVENDTNLAAVGEYWRGAAREIDNFVFIALGTGVGAGIFINGKLHRGAQWTAGEIGYMGVSGKKREPFRIRDLGQLEQVIGGGGIEAEWKRQISMMEDEDGLPPSRETLKRLRTLKATQIFDLAAEGDRAASQVVSRVAEILADSIADISLLLNPEVVVLGGGVGSHPELCRSTEKLVQRHEFAQPNMRYSSLGTQAQLHGGVCTSLIAVESVILK